MHSIAPIIKLREDLYACRTWSSYDSNKIKYDRNYAILAKTENGLACSLCTNLLRCLHIQMFYCTMFERKMYNLQAESDGVIFKPRPKKDNIFIHVDWESCPVPKATTIYVKKSFWKMSKPTTVTCATHTTKSDADPCAEHLEPFLRTKFHVKADTMLPINQRNNIRHYLLIQLWNQNQNVWRYRKNLFSSHSHIQNLIDTEIFSNLYMRQENLSKITMNMHGANTGILLCQVDQETIG